MIAENRNATDNWEHIPRRWEIYLAHDFGSSAPSVTYLIAKSPGGMGPDGRLYPRRSLVLVDELATARTGDLNKGLGWTVSGVGTRCINPLSTALFSQKRSPRIAREDVADGDPVVSGSAWVRRQNHPDGYAGRGSQVRAEKIQQVRPGILPKPS